MVTLTAAGGTSQATMATGCRLCLSGLRPSGTMGRGTEEAGGGPLRGGLVLMNRFTADTYGRVARG